MNFTTQHRRHHVVPDREAMIHVIVPDQNIVVLPLAPIDIEIDVDIDIEIDVTIVQEVQVVQDQEAAAVQERVEDNLHGRDVKGKIDKI